MCRLYCSLGSLSTLVVSCPGAAYDSPIFNLFIIAHEGLDHTQVTYRTSRCLMHFHRDESLPAITSALIRTPVVLFGCGSLLRRSGPLLASFTGRTPVCTRIVILVFSSTPFKGASVHFDRDG